MAYSQCSGCSKNDRLLNTTTAPFRGITKGEDSEPNDIRKIVQTYQFRTDEDRYSRRVSMAEIKKNGYNLNISRYVSTVTSAEVIDLEVVHAQLKSIEDDAAKALALHNQYLKELGLPLLWSEWKAR